MFAPETKEEQAARHRAEGRSEQEIAYFQADNQKDYEPILKDPNTPEKVISDIVDRITLVPLKVLAFKHPNISERSQRYMLEKADKKKYQKELIGAFLEGNLTEKNWNQIKEYYNVAKRTEKLVIELINEQIDVDVDKLDIILNTIKDDKDLQTIGFAMVEAIFKHKNFNVKILHGELFTKNPGLLAYNHIMKVIEESPYKAEIATTLYEITGREEVLPQEAKDLFLF
jgi:hypothetical protein